MKRKEPVWIDVRDVLAVHDQVLAQHGGASGIRDKNLLESALARPRQHYHYSDAADVIYLSALYVAAVVGNHPFVDGNKRTGFVAGILFLELNGFQFAASEEDTAQAVFSLASGKLDEDEFAHWLRSNTKRRHWIEVAPV